MKKLTALLLTLAMALSLAACGAKEEAPVEEEQKEEAPVEEVQAEGKAPGWWKEELTTIEDGKLLMATSPDFAPFEFYALDENGEPQLAGFDIALGHYIADYLGLELDVIPMNFDGTIMEIGQKNVDIAMAGYSPNEKRASQMDFSDVYLKGSQCIMTTKDKADQFPELESANNPEVQVGAQVGAIQADFAKEFTPDADILEMAKVTDLVAELLTGKLDVLYMSTMSAEAYQSQYPDLVITADVPYDAKGNVVGVSKGNEALLAGVNEAVAAALADGSMDQFVLEAIELSSGNIIEGLVE